MRPVTLLVGLAASVAAVDLFSKWLLFHTVGESRRLLVVPGFFALGPSRNTGGLFGVGRGRAEVFIFLSLAAIGLILWMFFTLDRPTRWPVMGLGSVLGGAAGNLWDRVIHGSVRDFLDVQLGSYHWPTFNVADVFICLGAAILILHAWRRSQASEEAEAAGTAAGKDAEAT